MSGSLLMAAPVSCFPVLVPISYVLMVVVLDGRVADAASGRE